MTDAADYVIVGAGSSGCVLADRLSENPRNKVILIESGPPDRSLFLHIPRGYGRLLGTKTDLLWTMPVRQDEASHPQYQIRGRTLGGTSAINGMMYMRGQSHDYDDWGLNGWGWNEIGRCFREMEHHELGGTGIRGGSGPLKISASPYGLAMCDGAIAAGGALGLPVREDLNAQDGDGIGYQPRTIWKGWRQSSAKAFLRRTRNRPNLTILTGMTVEHIGFNGKRATGVTIRQGDRRTVITARETILSAGALHSPKLLMLSGIGPAARLRELGIEVLHDAPEVGGNLADHQMLMLRFATNGASDNRAFGGWRLYPNALRQLLLGAGPLSRTAFEVGGYATLLPGSQGPDVQLLMGNFYSVRDGTRIVMGGDPGGTAGFYQTRPKSRGRLTITGGGFDAPLDIRPKPLSHEEDRRVAIAGVRFVRRWFAQAALGGLAPRELFPGPDVESDDEILDFLRRESGSAQHMCGTCRMGEDEQSVVDTQLRVRGVDGLRVMDISVFPGTPSGNPNGPAMAMAWRAAELIDGSLN